MADITISNSVVTITLDTGGTVTSVVYLADGVDKVHAGHADELFSHLYLTDDSTVDCDGITDLGGDQYECTYAGSSIVLTLTIEPVSITVEGQAAGWFKFTVDSVTGLVADLADLEKLRVCDFWMWKAVQGSATGDGAWARDAADDALFYLLLPIDTYSICEDVRYSSSPYRFQVRSDFGMAGKTAAFLTMPKSVYYQTIEALVLAEGLPYRTRDDDSWFKSPVDHGRQLDSYMLVDTNHANHETLLAHATRSGIHTFIPIRPFSLGTIYISNGKFATEAEYLADMQKFIDAGMRIGIHDYWGRLDTDDPIFSAANLRKVQIGTLAADINAVVTSIQLDLAPHAAFDENPELVFYRAKYTSTGNMIVITIDDEVIKAPVPNSDYLAFDTFGGVGVPPLACNRGFFGATTPAAHLAGTPVYMVLSDSTSGYYAADSALVEIAEAVAEMVRPLNLDAMYADGSMFFYDVDHLRAEYDTNLYNQQHWPFLDAFAKTADGLRDWTRLPRTQSANYMIVAGFYALDRRASADGVAFLCKEHTRLQKLDQLIIPFDLPFGSFWYEMGWWKIGGTVWADGKFDIDAVDSDDVHYAMFKDLAYGTAMGLQFGWNWALHEGINTLLDVISIYEDLTTRDRLAGGGVLITHAYLDSAKPSACDVELLDTDGDGEANEVVEKSETRRYCQWVDTDPFTFTAENPWDSSTELRFQIRPRVDYEDLGDPAHTELVAQPDFQVGPAGDGVASTSGAAVTIVADDALGEVEIANTSLTDSGWAMLTYTGAIDMQNKRGLALTIDGDRDGVAGDATVQVELRLGSRTRRYEFEMDFSDEQTKIMGYGVAYPSHLWHWFVDYSALTAVRIRFTVPPDSSYNVKLLSLKALAEKGTGQVVNPEVTINGQRIVFDGFTLTVDDVSAHVLDYRDGAATLRNSNLGAVANPPGSSVTLPDGPIILATGANDVSITSDDGDADYSRRAEMRVEIRAPANHFPVLAPIGDRTIDADNTLTFGLSAADEDGDELAFSATGLPAGATLVGSTFSWTPTDLQVGTHSVTFVVSDGELGDFEIVTITVVEEQSSSSSVSSTSSCSSPGIPSDPVGKSITVLGPASGAVIEIGPSSVSIVFPVE